MSGLMRAGKSVVGPTELKVARTPSVSTAPTVITLSPSAGPMSVLWVGSKPLLPAEFTTTMPRPAARSAARVITIVLPSMSCQVALGNGASKSK